MKKNILVVKTFYKKQDSRHVPVECIGMKKPMAKTYQGVLKVIFNYYSTLYTPVESLRSKFLTYDQIKLANSTISLTELLSFCRSFLIVPNLLSQAGVNFAWQRQRQRTSDVLRKSNRLDFSNFVEVLARIGVLAFPKEKDLPSRVEKLIKFLDLENFCKFDLLINVMKRVSQGNLKKNYNSEELKNIIEARNVTLKRKFLRRKPSSYSFNFFAGKNAVMRFKKINLYPFRSNLRFYKKNILPLNLHSFRDERRFLLPPSSVQSVLAIQGKIKVAEDSWKTNLTKDMQKKSLGSPNKSVKFNRADTKKSLLSNNDTKIKHMKRSQSVPIIMKEENKENTDSEYSFQAQNYSSTETQISDYEALDLDASKLQVYPSYRKVRSINVFKKQKLKTKYLKEDANFFSEVAAPLHRFVTREVKNPWMGYAKAEIKSHRMQRNRKYKFKVCVLSQADRIIFIGVRIITSFECPFLRCEVDANKAAVGMTKSIFFLIDKNTTNIETPFEGSILISCIKKNVEICSTEVPFWLHWESKNVSEQRRIDLES
eukprot:snap_masked-scaffold_2-processed-gene-24.14-mRNA-1 protein AED:1.00 eAED:1.00 QI:0/-1/0/0/-1/1/1/0/541